MRISAIILAAGSSKRMGCPKIFLPVEGKPMILYSINLALKTGLSPIYVVGGKYSQDIRPLIKELPVKLIYNESYEKGMSTSLQKGIKAVKGECEATMIFLADQPFTPLAVIEEVLSFYRIKRDSGTKIVRPKYNKNPGHPILFDSFLFDDFKFLSGDNGGKTIIERNRRVLEYTNHENELWGKDIDTLQDYNSLCVN